MVRQVIMTLALLAFPAASLIAQEGPYVPCVDCGELTQAPFPESGLWYNPDQSGTGFTFEIQNGVMAGYYYGYDIEGEPEWYLVAGQLERSESSGVMWELEVEPQRFTGGNCLGCPYQAPGEPDALPAIKIEYLQRAYARVTLGDGSVQYIVPIMYGDAGKAFFSEQTPYLFPQVTADPYASLWTLVFKEPGEEEHAPWTWSPEIFMISEAEVSTGGPNEGRLVYRIYLPGPPPEVAIQIGEITCGPDATSGEAVCELHMGSVLYQIPIGNLTDSRFFGEAEDGTIVQGFRLQYD